MKQALVSKKISRTALGPSLSSLTPRPLVQAIAISLSLAATAHAKEIVVTTNQWQSIDNECSLYDAIRSADNDTSFKDCPAGDPGHDTISLENFAGQQFVWAQFIGISSAITLQGYNATVGDSGRDRMFRLYAGADLVLNDVTLTGGSPAIEVRDGSLHLNRSTITNSEAHRFDGNPFAGAIHATGGNIYIDSSTISDTAYKPTQDGWGAIYLNNAASTLVVENSTISGNSAWMQGAAIMLAAGKVFLRQSTLASNSARFGQYANRWGDVHLQGVDSTLYIKNSILADPLASFNPQSCSSILGASVVLQGGAIIENSDRCGWNFFQDPNLGPLADNGGPTRTHAIPTDSIAWDKAACIGGIATDQRGEARDDTRCDIGAFEVQVARQVGPEFVVTRTADSDDGECDVEPGDCTLREAVIAADAFVGTPTITFANSLTAPPATITLSGGALALSPGLNILGAGVTIDAAGSSGIFTINGSPEVNLEDLHLLNASGPNGAIGVDGMLQLKNSSIQNSYSSQNGGAINASFSSLVDVEGTLFSGNTAAMGGGAIYLGGGDAIGWLGLVDSQVTNNRALGVNGHGGGIWHRGGSFYLIDSSVSGNSAELGGGLVLENSFGSVQIMGSTIHANTADEQGGGLILDNFDVPVFNSTISGNSAGLISGAVKSTDSSLLLYNSTVMNNTAASLGGVDVDGGTLGLSNTILAGSNNKDSRLAGGTGVEFTGVNLVQNPYNNYVIRTWITGVDPQLGPLADNGGPTLTHLPAPDSPVVNAGDNGEAGAQQMWDQRGADYFRVVGTIDLGSVEISAASQEGPDFTVTSLEDRAPSGCFLAPGECTLRDALLAANADVDASTITFSEAIQPLAPESAALTIGPTPVPGTITLTGALPDIDTHVTIQGSGMTLDADGNIRHVTITNNPDPEITPSVDLHDLSFIGANNTADIHGAVTIYRADVDIYNSTFSGNYTIDAGAALFIDASTVSIHQSTIFANTAYFGGGGISLNRDYSVLNIYDSTLEGNSSGYTGGAIEVRDATLQVFGSTISGNTADKGGGVSVTAGTAGLTNTTLSGNTAHQTGGGLLSGQAAVYLSHVTVLDNSAINAFGRQMYFNGGTWGMSNSVIANLRADNFYDYVDTVTGTPPTLDWSGVNLIRNPKTDYAEPSLITRTLPAFGPLADNGGPTLTHLPLGLAPVVNGGDNVDAAGDTDQRGNDRIFGSAVDLGAVELQKATQIGPDFIVTVNDDTDDGTCEPAPGGHCSLREAMVNASLVPDATTITFANALLNPMPTTITLAGSRLPDVITDVTIQGSGVTIDADQKSAIFNANSASMGTDLTLDGLVMKNGRAIGFPQGAIHVSGVPFSMHNSTVADSYSNQRGGGLYLNAGRDTITITGSTITNNMAMGPGGGIYARAYGSGALNITDSVISDNMGSYARGGGLSAQGIHTQLYRSQVTGNLVQYGPGEDQHSYGGGIAVEGETFVAIESTISGNTAQYGGGVFVDGSISVNVTNSTLDSNFADHEGSGLMMKSAAATLDMLGSTVSNNGGNSSGMGGGLSLEGASARIINSTLSGNTNGTTGSAIAFNGVGSAELRQVTIVENVIINDISPVGALHLHDGNTLTVANSIIYNPSSLGDCAETGAPSTINFEGVNLVEDFNNCSAPGAGTLTVPPELGPLADNGGPTQTHLPVEGSPVIDSGDSTEKPDGDFDQRGMGFSRIFGSSIDLGALEWFPTAEIIFGDGFEGPP